MLLKLTNFQELLTLNKEITIITYSTIDITIRFEKSITIRNPLIFTFRSTVGKELKRISCLFKKRKSCDECIINNSCPYSFYFESPEFERGSKKPHPYILFVNFQHNVEITNAVVTFTFLGEKAISNFPYLFYSLMRSGEKGIFKDRIKFNITDVKANNQSIYESNDKINMDFERKLFKIETNFEYVGLKNYKINFLTPVRIKKDGKLLTSIDYSIFIKSMFRRFNLLNKIYGSNEIDKFIDFNRFLSVKYQKSKFDKKSFNYYSSRQKRKVLLIGIQGYLDITKEFTDFEISLLKSAEIFGVGSNTTFGFGKVMIVQD